VICVIIVDLALKAVFYNVKPSIIGVVTRVWAGILVLGVGFLQGQKLLLLPADSHQLWSQLSFLSNVLFPRHKPVRP